MALSSIDAYKQQATQEYDPQYNAQVNNLKASLANQMTAYDKQAASANSTFDKQVKDQNFNTELTKNNYNNNMLSRGLQRSSIATSGFAGLDDKNSRLVGDINSNRTSTLGQIDTDRANYNANYNMQINQLGADRESQIAALARQLYDSEWQKDYQNRQLAQEAAIAAANRAAYSSSSSKAADTSVDTYAMEKYAIDRIWNDPSYKDFDTKMAALKKAQESLASNGASLAGLQYADQKVMGYQDYINKNTYKAPVDKTPNPYTMSYRDYTNTYK